MNKQKGRTEERKKRGKKGGKEKELYKRSPILFEHAIARVPTTTVSVMNSEGFVS